MLILIKTQVTAFHLRNKDAKRSLKVVWNKTELENTIHPKYLGVRLDRLLSYTQHIRNTKMKIVGVPQSRGTVQIVSTLSCLSEGPVPQFFLGSQSCDPASLLAERQLLAGDIESNPGQKPTLKLLLHTLTQSPTLNKYTNSPVQPSQLSPPPLSPAHSLPNSPTFVQSHLPPLQNTPTYHRAYI